MWKLLLAAILLLVTSCVAPAAQANDGAVYVSPAYPAASATAARVGAQLRPGDGIVVHILGFEDRTVPPDTIVITATFADVSVIAGDGWLNQVVAENMLQRAKNIAADPVDRVILFIRSIHAWQDKNPRPLPPEPPRPPNYTWAWWTGGSIAVVLLVLLITWRVRVKGRIESGLAQRADDPEYWKKTLEDLNKKVGE